jgi:hypothetical protein
MSGPPREGDLPPPRPVSVSFAALASRFPALTRRLQSGDKSLGEFCNLVRPSMKFVIFFSRNN